MDKVVIKVPKGQVAEVNKQSDGNVLVTFKDVEHWKLIKSVQDAVNYLKSNSMCQELIDEYQSAPCGSYSEKLAMYRIVVAALTNNEECHLTTGVRWMPVVQFCEPEKELNCIGNKIIGTIKSEGQEYTVVCGDANYSAIAGLGDFRSNGAVSDSYSYLGFRSVSSKEIAQYISEQFGRLLFEVQYGGVNCNWEWVD